jgi:hypothetical protein
MASHWITSIHTNADDDVSRLIMKTLVSFVIAFASCCSVTAAPNKNLTAEVAVVPQTELVSIMSHPEAPLPPTANYDTLNRAAAIGPAYLVVRINDNSGGIAWGTLEVKIDTSTIELPVSATLQGKNYDYFVPLSFGFNYKREGSEPTLSTNWKRLRFK